jgi:hypothetical protein
MAFGRVVLYLSWGAKLYDEEQENLYNKASTTPAARSIKIEHFDHVLRRLCDFLHFLAYGSKSDQPSL